METLNNYESIISIIENNRSVLIYAKSKGCKVCDIMLPKVYECTQKHGVTLGIVVIDDIPKFSGQFTVYTVPTVLLFVNQNNTERYYCSAKNHKNRNGFI